MTHAQQQGQCAVASILLVTCNCCLAAVPAHTHTLQGMTSLPGSFTFMTGYRLSSAICCVPVQQLLYL
jgi:hypothetical protein